MNERAESRELNDDQQYRVELLRISFSSMFNMIDERCKPSRETSLGITKLEEALFWLVKGISREETGKEEK